jgi:hypothetical protein
VLTLSSLNVNALARAITEIYGRVSQQPEFLQSIQLQIALDNMDIPRERMFSSTLRLPHPKGRICILLIGAFLLLHF